MTAPRNLAQRNGFRCGAVARSSKVFVGAGLAPPAE